MKDYTVIELFAGAGGLALGVEEAGFENLLCVECDKNCTATLATNRPEWDILTEDVKNVDFKGYAPTILTGGFPCQPFSYAGKRMGLQDVRGTLFYEYARALAETQPVAFIAENVQGLLSNDNGNTYMVIKEVFESLGYVVQEKVLNASYHGVGQRRKRLFIVGIKQGLFNRAIEKGVHFNWPVPDDIQTTLGDVLKDCPMSEGSSYNQRKLDLFRRIPAGGCWKDLPLEDAVAYLPALSKAHGNYTGVLHRCSFEKPCPTILTTPQQKLTERCHPIEDRPLTIRECARIQSFPDNWVFVGSKTSQYKQIGNAVPPLLAKKVALSLREYLDTCEEFGLLSENQVGK